MCSMNAQIARDPVVDGHGHGLVIDHRHVEFGIHFVTVRVHDFASRVKEAKYKLETIQRHWSTLLRGKGYFPPF